MSILCVVINISGCCCSSAIKFYEIFTELSTKIENNILIFMIVVNVFFIVLSAQQQQQQIDM
jgi:uncharacterized membrane protein